MELDFPRIKPWILSCSGGLHWIDWNCRFSSEQSQTDWPNNTILFQPNSRDGSLRSSVSHSLLCVFLLSIPPQLPVIHASNYRYMQVRTSIHYQWDRDPKTIHYLIHSHLCDPPPPIRCHTSAQQALWTAQWIQYKYNFTRLRPI